MTAQQQETDTFELHLVRVWFGTNVIAKYTAERDAAARYAKAMGRRFAGLRVTNDVVPAPIPGAARLPSELLWQVTPH